LAVIIGTEGPSYRPLGAMMAIFRDGRRVGSLSSGCIESDLALHAKTTLASGHPVRLRYGTGSPFVDIQLPCGGGLEVLLLPRPNPKILADLATAQAARKAKTLIIDPETGDLDLAAVGDTGWQGARFLVRQNPDLFFHIFGKGPEASTFAGLVRSAGFPGVLISPDPETLGFGASAGCETRHIKSAEFPRDLRVDTYSAIVLFFHDHEWEPPILAQALASDAFYIGAQGSQRARDTRLAALEDLGVTKARLARLRGPIGLVPSARDARTLAVSVLAEVLQMAQVTG
jgi:xanthine dehydrogenase accessory factor